MQVLFETQRSNKTENPRERCDVLCGENTEADFREFTAKSLGRQMADHAEMEGQAGEELLV